MFTAFHTQSELGRCMVSGELMEGNLITSDDERDLEELMFTRVTGVRQPVSQSARQDIYTVIYGRHGLTMVQ